MTSEIKVYENVKAVASDVLGTIINDRSSTHGDPGHFAHVFMRMLAPYLNAVREKRQFEDTDAFTIMEIMKLARQAVGNEDHYDHYRDAAAYSILKAAYFYVEPPTDVVDYDPDENFDPTTGLEEDDGNGKLPEGVKMSPEELKMKEAYEKAFMTNQQVNEIPGTRRVMSAGKEPRPFGAGATFSEADIEAMYRRPIETEPYRTRDEMLLIGPKLVREYMAYIVNKDDVPLPQMPLFTQPVPTFMKHIRKHFMDGVGSVPVYWSPTTIHDFRVYCRIILAGDGLGAAVKSD